MRRRRLRGEVLSAHDQTQFFESLLRLGAAEVFRANGLFRAVVLPPGDHRITFRYEPRSFTWGLRASVASLALWGGVSAWALARHRRDRTAA